MKRLFVLRRGRMGDIFKDNGVTPYFADKMTAKAARDRLGDGAVVSYGPDHDKFRKSNPKHGDK